MNSNVAAGRHDAGGPRIHRGVLDAVTAVYDALFGLIAALPQPPDPANPFSAARAVGLPPPPVSFLRHRHDSAAPRPGQPLALPPTVDDSPLGRLRDALCLTPFETALLALALLPEIDARAQVAIAYLQGDLDSWHARPTLDLALRLFAPDDPDPSWGPRVLEPEAPLRAWEMLVPPPEDAATIDYPLRLERALHWSLLGSDALDPAVVDLDLAFLEPTADAAVAFPDALPTPLDPSRGAGGVIMLYGGAEPVALAMARAAARARGQDLLLLNGGGLARLGEDGPRLLRRGLREALLRGLLPCLHAGALLLVPGAARGAAYDPLAYRRVLDACPCPVLLLEGGGDGPAATLGVAGRPIVVRLDPLSR